MNSGFRTLKLRSILTVPDSANSSALCLSPPASSRLGFERRSRVSWRRCAAFESRHVDRSSDDNCRVSSNARCQKRCKCIAPSSRLAISPNFGNEPADNGIPTLQGDRREQKPACCGIDQRILRAAVESTAFRFGCARTDIPADDWVLTPAIANSAISRPVWAARRSMMRTSRPSRTIPVCTVEPRSTARGVKLNVRKLGYLVRRPSWIIHWRSSEELYSGRSKRRVRSVTVASRCSSSKESSIYISRLAIFVLLGDCSHFAISVLPSPTRAPLGDLSNG
jgi:hypothetical protein